MHTLLSAIRAETVRTRHSAAAYLPWVGLIIAAISSAGILLTPENQERAALLWQTLYVTGMAVPLMTLLAGLTTAREASARDGGTLWRPTSPRTIILARFLVLVGLSAVFHILVFWTVIPLSLLAGAPTDVAGIFTAGLCCWVATLGVLALGYITTERWGTIPVFLIAWAWQIVGSLAAESPAWPLIPPTWAVRAMLPLLGAHQNAEPLSPTDPLASESPTLTLILGLLLAIVVLLVRMIAPRTTRSEQRGDNRPVGKRSTREGSLGAVQTIMRARAVLPLCGAAVVLAVATAIIYPNTYLTGLHTYALLPLGACIIAVLAWQALIPGWRILLTRRATIPAAVQSWLLLCVAIVTAAVTFVALLNAVRRGQTDATALLSLGETAALWLILGAAGVLGALWITVRFGVGWALGVTVILTILGVTIGGDILADTWLWILGPTAWPLSADTPVRFVIAAVCGIVITVMAWVGSARALFHAPARGI